MSHKLQPHVKKLLLEDQEKLLNDLLKDVDKELSLDGSTNKKTRNEIIDTYRDKLDNTIIEILERKPQFVQSVDDITQYIQANIFESKTSRGKKFKNKVSNTKQSVGNILQTQKKTFGGLLFVLILVGGVKFAPSFWEKIDAYYASPEYIEKQREKEQKQKEKEQKEYNSELQNLIDANYQIVTVEQRRLINLLDEFLISNDDLHTYFGSNNIYYLERFESKKNITYVVKEVKSKPNKELGGFTEQEKIFQINTTYHGAELLYSIDQNLQGTTITYINEEAKSYINQLLEFTNAIRTSYIQEAQEDIDIIPVPQDMITLPQDANQKLNTTCIEDMFPNDGAIENSSQE